MAALGVPCGGSSRAGRPRHTGDAVCFRHVFAAIAGF